MTATIPLSEMDRRNCCESYPLSAITYSPSYPLINSSACVMSCLCPAVSMNLRGLPRLSTLTWTLVLNPPRLLPSACDDWPPFFGRSPSALVSPNDRTVYDEILHVRFFDDELVHLLPYTAFCPSGEALVDGVPLAVLDREHPPLRTCASDPENSFDEQLAFVFCPDVYVGAFPKECENLRPLFWRYRDI